MYIKAKTQLREAKYMKMEVVFFPFMAHGHIIPFLDLARLFASRGVKATFVTTPANAPTLSESDNINLEIIPFPSEEVGLPIGLESIDQQLTLEFRIKFIEALKLMSEGPLLKQLLVERRPMCLVADMFLPWTAEVASKARIPWVAFSVGGYFSLSVLDFLRRKNSQWEVESEDEEFVLPEFPTGEVKLSRKILPTLWRVKDEEKKTTPFLKLHDLAFEVATNNSFGVIVNTFRQLEADYAEHFQMANGIRCWSLGPLSLCCRGAGGKTRKMGFWTLFEVASMPILQVLMIGGLGAFMATSYCNLLPADTRRSLNKIVFMIFTPSLMFAYLAKTVTFQQIVSWWFMPVNVGLTFLFGGILGWIAVKLLKPERHLEGLVIALSSAGNLGNLMLIIVPAICNERGSPFGEHEACRSIGLSYASFSMALGGFYIWTYTFHLVRSTAISYKALQPAMEVDKEPNRDFDANEKTQLLNGEKGHFITLAVPLSQSPQVDTENQAVQHVAVKTEKKSIWRSVKEFIHQIIEELMSPPTISAMFGLVFGAVPWLKNLIIGESAPFHVIQDCLQTLGNGTIPCITLILGGNLTQGFKTGKLKKRMIIGVLVVKYVLLPIIGVGVVQVASKLGFLPDDPLYHFVLMIQFSLPPAMNIGTMAQLFDVGQEECSVLYLWTYSVAAFALTFWSTVFMWILS